MKTGLALTVCIAVLPVTALAKSDFADWRESLRWQVCVNQPVFHQEKEEMKKELEVTLANLLAVEKVSSVRALGRKTAPRRMPRGEGRVPARRASRRFPSRTARGSRKRSPASSS